MAVMDTVDGEMDKQTVSSSPAVSNLDLPLSAHWLTTRDDPRLGGPSRSLLPQQPPAGLPSKPPTPENTDRSITRKEPVTPGQVRFRQMLEGMPPNPQGTVGRMDRLAQAQIHGQQLFSPVQAGSIQMPPQMPLVSYPNALPQQEDARALEPFNPNREWRLSQGSYNRHPDQGDGERRGVREQARLVFPAGQLSTECQKRKFNPAFRAWQTREGKFQCLVNIQGKIITDKRTWGSPGQAKQEISKKALQYLHENGHYGSSTNTSQGSISGSSRGDERRRDDRRREDGKRSHQIREEEELEAALLLARIRRIYGRSDGMRSEISADPTASRAFLEGFAWGARAANRSADERMRSRSPRRVADERRRSRSSRRGGDDRRRRG